MGIEVVLPGLQTTVQDLGRRGHASEGFPECGACDRYAMAAANLLAGNPPGAAGLEFTLIGPELRFPEPAVVSLCGPGLHPRVNGIEQPAWRPIRLDSGDVLQVGAMSAGMRGCLAVHGGIDVPEILGSRSTDLMCRIGGLDGAPLKKQSLLPSPGCDAEALWPRLVKVCERLSGRWPLERNHSPEPTVRVLPGPQFDRFSEEARQGFTGQRYAVGMESNRMGLRLTGIPLPLPNGADILSDGILEGSVQLSSNGQPIVMLADHQTVGGYAKLATVIPTDLPVLAQLKPGESVAFQYTTPRQALKALRREAARLGRWQRAIERISDL